ncbi:rhodanese-like domain-containing protein [Jannaschia formosa]|uniref:rhodanese-like domain-containing protein n=1 Tax=Jannaschia formosa TaxID=2259592 RepID=UPI000E1C2767|nr:rhodanese-like domain-containing protein [Jannaschia formosa]TFL18951.1 rhodanese-like domain-containing protein [Jannaschia formosa]
MSTDAGRPVDEVDPRGAWKVLSDDGDALLVDVRSAAEWGFVGGPDLSALGREVVRIEWQTWPGMSPNPAFVGALMDRVGDTPPTLLFLCRSGVRSKAAARAVTQAYAGRGVAVRCLNVAEGFEGDLDPDGHRGALGGWKASGLAWRQT